MGRGDFADDERLPSREERIIRLNLLKDQLKSDIERIETELVRLRRP